MPLCRTCDEPFILHRSHQGFANVCPSCSTGDVDRVMGKVAWSGKHCMELEITSNRAEAMAFNRAQRRRNGACPIGSIIASRESQAGREASKQGSGAEFHALYISKLGEKRTVKDERK